MRPDVRPKKLTRRSASPSGNVFRMMASVSRAGMNCRRADSDSLFPRGTAKIARECELEFLSHARLTRNPGARLSSDLFWRHQQKYENFKPNSRPWILLTSPLA